LKLPGSTFVESITTIALYDGRSVFHYVNGYDLDDFKRRIPQYDVLVTYNGKCFDVPFIERYFSIKLNQAHIDLRYVLGGLGFTGSLRTCEKNLGIGRGELEGIDGFFGVLLWEDYKRNHNDRTLETLLAYNVADVLKLKDTPFLSSYLIDSPPDRENPFRA